MATNTNIKGNDRTFESTFGRTVQKGDIVQFRTSLKSLRQMKGSFIDIYAIYDGEGNFIVNSPAVGVFKQQEDIFVQNMRYYELVKVKRFQGSEQTKANILKRAENLVKRKEYSTISFNGEHFLDYLMGRELHSETIKRYKNIGIGLLAGSLFTGSIMYVINRK